MQHIIRVCGKKYNGVTEFGFSLRNLCCPDRMHARGMLYLPKVSRILCAYLGLDCAALSVRKVMYCEATARRKFSLPTTNYNASPVHTSPLRNVDSQIVVAIPSAQGFTTRLNPFQDRATMRKSDYYQINMKLEVTIALH